MRCLSVKSGVRCHVHLTAKDWIDTCCLRSLVKVNDTKHHSMVCDRCTVHAKLFHSCNIFFYFIRAIQKGKLEGNTVFTYLDAFSNEGHFAEYLPEYANLDELKDHYKRGGLGDVKVKKFLNNVLQEELSPIRARRAEYEKNIEGVYEILKKGSEVAAETAAQTLSEVKAAMKINYFDDPAFLEEQIQKFNE